MAWLKRAKKPDVPDASAHSYGTPPLGGDPNNLGWVWGAIDAGMWSGVAPLWAAAPVTEDEVLAIPAVSASLSLLTTYALQMPLQAVREASTPPEVLQPTPTILTGPLGDARTTGVTLADWVDSVIRELALYGNYVAVLGDAGWDGWPRTMYPVGAGLWQARRTNGVRTYTVGEDDYDASEIFHVAINRRAGQLVGRGLLSSNRDTINAAVMAERWAARYFETGTAPSVVITHPNPDLTQAQADDLKGKFLDATSGQRRPVVAPLGTTVEVMPNDAESAQLVEARKWSNTALAIALGVPPAMLGLEQSSMTYRNIAEVNQQVISTTEMRYLVPVEQQLTAQCLVRGVRARFDTQALVRPDQSERMNQAIAGLRGGLLTADEARAMIDLGPNPELEGAGSGTPAPEPVPVMPDQPPALIAVGSGEP